MFFTNDCVLKCITARFTVQTQQVIILICRRLLIITCKEWDCWRRRRWLTRVCYCYRLFVFVCTSANKVSLIYPQPNCLAVKQSDPTLFKTHHQKMHQSELRPCRSWSAHLKFMKYCTSRQVHSSDHQSDKSLLQENLNALIWLLIKMTASQPICIPHCALIALVSGVRQNFRKFLLQPGIASNNEDN